MIANIMCTVMMAFMIVVLVIVWKEETSDRIRYCVTALCLIMLFGITTMVYFQRKETEHSGEEESKKEKLHSDEIDAIMRSLPDSSGVMLVNLTEDTIISYYGNNEKIREAVAQDRRSDAIGLCRDALLEGVSEPEYIKSITELLDRDNLTELFSKNEKEKKITYSERMPDGSIEVREAAVRMLRNLSNGNIEVAVQVADISDDWYCNVVGSYLATRQFMFTTVVFINSKRGRSLANNSDMGKENKFYDYEFYRRDIYEHLIDLNERDEFMEKTEAEVVKQMLEKEPVYSVFTHAVAMMPNGRLMKRYLRYEFQYLDDAKEIVLLCVADETTVWEADVLTGINNYKGFVSQAKFVLESSAPEDEFSVIVTNIKWFKVINKIFGSAKCDEFLKGYAARLAESPLEPVVIGRFPASDHFIMLVRREKLTVEEIMNISHQVITNGEREVDALVTCGIYNVSDRNVSVPDMVDHAIMAFKGIKDVYNIPYAIFSEQEEERYLSGKLAVSGFDKALREGEFQPFYQPIFDAKTHKVVSAEALVRWKKDGAFIPPGMFIPALEENGSVSRVDMYISERVTEFLRRRKSQGRLVVPVSVNLSAMDFYAAEAIDGVMRDIDTMIDHSIVPRYEITETAWADAADNRNDIIETMRAKGTQILIDDFGSGYSSFSTLRDINFDILKIDMGFIRKIGLSQKTDGIVSSIINMAHFIGLKVVAEGVETKEHLDFLTEHGCDYIQGYYFSMPLPEDEFEKLLDSQE